jgi:hypothetical protein
MFSIAKDYVFTIVFSCFKCSDHAEFAIHPNMATSVDGVMAFYQRFLGIGHGTDKCFYS